MTVGPVRVRAVTSRAGHVRSVPRPQDDSGRRTHRRRVAARDRQARRYVGVEPDARPDRFAEISRGEPVFRIESAPAGG